MERVTRNWQVSIGLSNPIRVSLYHFGIRRHCQLGNSIGRKPNSRQCDGTADFWLWHENREAWFNTAAFAAPAAFTFGNAGRNSVYGPGMQALDFAIVRLFTLTERAKFQFRGEFFNALNHTNLGTPDRFVNTPQFGTITESTTPGREIQLSARVMF